MLMARGTAGGDRCRPAQRGKVVAATLLFSSLLHAAPDAQAPATAPIAADVSTTAAIDGPPPPLPPAVMSRDADRRTTVRAVRLDEPLRIDGRLDEAVYETVLAMTDFVQQDPVENAPATEKTEVWVFFDRDHVYVVGLCWESQPERMIVN